MNSIVFYRVVWIEPGRMVYGAHDYSNREAAEQCMAWHRKHPTPDDLYLDMKLEECKFDPDDTFVPPYSEERYHELYDDYLRELEDECHDF